MSAKASDTQVRVLAHLSTRYHRLFTAVSVRALNRPTIDKIGEDAWGGHGWGTLLGPGISYRECGIEIPKKGVQSFNNQSITSLSQSLRSPKMGPSTGAINWSHQLGPLTETINCGSLVDCSFLIVSCYCHLLLSHLHCNCLLWFALAGEENKE